MLRVSHSWDQYLLHPLLRDRAEWGKFGLNGRQINTIAERGILSTHLRVNGTAEEEERRFGTFNYRQMLFAWRVPDGVDCYGMGKWVK